MRRWTISQGFALGVITRATLPILALVCGAILSAIGTSLVRRRSAAIGFVDLPDGRKAHGEPVPLGGGIAITLATLLPIVVAIGLARIFAENPPSWMPEAVRVHLAGIASKTFVGLGIVIAAVTMCAIGLADDARPMQARVKLLGQFLIALFLVVGCDLRLMSHLPGGVSIFLSVFWILTLTNSFNFLDNMDGLAAGVGMIAAAVFASTAFAAGQLFVPVCCALLAGALLGFLPSNFHPARIYMGDAGSMVIGLLLAVFTILTTFAAPAEGQEPFGVLAPLVVMAVPLYDTCSVVYLWWRLGVPIWTGDRRHFSHRLLQRGMGVRQAVLVIWLATLVTALPALLLPHASWPLAWGVVIQSLLVVSLVALLESGGRESL